jgi:photosystem II stability/assembly factor-like uncharacterized protein
MKLLLGLGLVLTACSNHSGTPAPAPTDDSGADATAQDGHVAAPHDGSDDTYVPYDNYVAPPPGGWRSVVGQLGTFAQTTNDVTWATWSVGATDLFAVTCVGNYVGWVAGDGGLVAHTMDGGFHWSLQSSGFTTALRTIRFGTGSLGVVAGDGGALATTSDGGVTWTQVATSTSAALRGATVAPSAGVMLAFGDGGVALRSADAGASWTSVSVPGAADFHGVATDDGAHAVYAVDDAGAIWSSGDGALTFRRESVAPVRLDAVAMSDDGAQVVAVGAGGTVLVRDASGGWSYAARPTASDLHAALVTSGGARFYVAGDAGELHTSVDGGLTWSRVPLATHAALFGLEDL